MKRLVSITVLIALAMPAPALAGSTFKNCTALRKVYPQGVAFTRKAAKETGATYKPAVYKANSKMDRDSDLVACEK